jgi:hypothetical protein
MRTTVDFPDSDLALFKSLARAQGVTVSQLILSLARGGLRQDSVVNPLNLNPLTGLPTIRSARAVSDDDVRQFLSEEH